MAAGHAVAVVDKGGRYPYQPTCTCGWSDWGYVAAHAAQILADAHLNGDTPKGLPSPAA